MVAWVLGLLAGAAVGAPWAQTTLQERIEAADLVVVAKIADTQKGFTRDRYYVLAKLEVAEVLKGDRTVRQVELAFPGRPMKATDVLYSQGQQGAFVLRKDKARDCYWGEHFRDYQPGDKIEEVRAVCRRLAGEPVEPAGTTQPALSVPTPTTGPSAPGATTQPTTQPGAGTTQPAERVKAFIEMVRSESGGVLLADAYRQVAEVAGFSDAELQELVGVLIFLLRDETVIQYKTPSGGTVRRQVRHRAAMALDVAAGISFGTFPAEGGPAAAPRARGGRQPAKPALDLPAAWSQWWASARSKTRKEWLALRRPLIREQLAGTQPDADAAAATLTVLVLLKDTSAAGELLWSLERMSSSLAPIARANPTAELMVRVILALGELGDRSMVRKLVQLAKVRNGPEIAYQAAIPQAYATTLNALTGLRIDAIKTGYYDLKGPKDEPIRAQLSVIEEAAFGQWLQAAGGPAAPVGAPPAGQPPPSDL